MVEPVNVISNKDAAHPDARTHYTHIPHIYPHLNLPICPVSMKIDTGRKDHSCYQCNKSFKASCKGLHPFEQGSSSEHIDESVPESYRAVYCSTFPPPHRGGGKFSKIQGFPHPFHWFWGRKSKERGGERNCNHAINVTSLLYWITCTGEMFPCHKFVYKGAFTYYVIIFLGFSTPPPPP